MTTLEYSILMFLVMFVISAVAMWSDDDVIHANTLNPFLRDPSHS